MSEARWVRLCPFVGQAVPDQPAGKRPRAEHRLAPTLRLQGQAIPTCFVRDASAIRILLHLELDKVVVHEGRANPIDLRFKVQLHVVLQLRSVP